MATKRILITAGPTWVPIDNVRVISNIATGRTGILLAEKFRRLGAQVTLVLGPTEACCLNKKIKLIRFEFFAELFKIVKRELKSKKYNIVIHSAAVSDYRPRILYRHKVKSGIKQWKLNLRPTLKIIDSIKKTDPSLFLVGFKFEPQVSKKILIDKAKALIKRASLDLAVANSLDRNRYRAYILDRDKIYATAWNKKDMAEKLVTIIREKIIWKD